LTPLSGPGREHSLEQHGQFGAIIAGVVRVTKALETEYALDAPLTGFSPFAAAHVPDGPIDRGWKCHTVDGWLELAGAKAGSAIEHFAVGAAASSGCSAR